MLEFVNPMPKARIITVRDFRTFRRREGVWGAIQNLVVRDYQTVRPVDRVTFGDPAR